MLPFFFHDSSEYASLFTRASFTVGKDMYLEEPYLELETLGQMLKELSYPEKNDQIHGGELCCFRLFIELLCMMLAKLNCAFSVTTNLIL